MQTGEIIAANLKRIRGERNLSLGQLAKMSGVSKALLYLMEDGDSNPTIDTLLKIAKALHLSYANLLELPEAQVILRKKTDLSAFRGEDYLAFNYYERDGDRKVELQQIELEPGCVHESPGHAENSSEYIIMTNGQMILEICGEEYLLETGDGLCFEAAAHHVYRNRTDRKAEAILLLAYN